MDLEAIFVFAIQLVLNIVRGTNNGDLMRLKIKVLNCWNYVTLDYDLRQRFFVHSLLHVTRTVPCA